MCSVSSRHGKVHCWHSRVCFVRRWDLLGPVGSCRLRAMLSGHLWFWAPTCERGRGLHALPHWVFESCSRCRLESDLQTMFSRDFRAHEPKHSVHAVRARIRGLESFGQQLCVLFRGRLCRPCGHGTLHGLPGWLRATSPRSRCCRRHRVGMQCVPAGDVQRIWQVVFAVSGPNVSAGAGPEFLRELSGRC